MSTDQESRSDRRTSASGLRMRVVNTAQAVLQDRLNEPISIAALSQAVGVSERTLRNAFVDVCHESPKRYFFKRRLWAVRHALRAADPAATVTAIATAHGFFELGRFAVQYKAAFGESPSRTLQTLRGKDRAWKARTLGRPAMHLPRSA